MTRRHKTDVFAFAKEFTEGWYLELRGKSRDQLKTERTFANAAKQFFQEDVPLNKDKRNPRYSKIMKRVITTTSSRTSTMWP